MQRSWLRATAAAVVVVVLFGAASAQAASPFVGNWKLIDVSRGHEVGLVLFQLAEKDGKLQAKVLAAPLLGEEVMIENVKADGNLLTFNVNFSNEPMSVRAHLPKPDARNKTVLGSIHHRNRFLIAQFDRTDDTELSEDDARRTTTEGEELGKALGIEGAAKQQEALKEIIEKYGRRPVAYPAYEALLRSYTEEMPKDEEVRATAEKFVQTGAAFGPLVEKHATILVGQILNRGEKVSPVALEYAQRGEKSLSKDDPPGLAIAALKTLATALHKNKKEDAAKALEPRIDKLEEALDTEYVKTAVPFKPDPYKGRKSTSKRIAVVELFTGAYCPPCVAADVAFDAVAQSYKPKDVVLLQYHLHIPRPDRLTNPDTEARVKYYSDSVDGTPTAFINGAVTQPLGGGRTDGKTSFETLQKGLNEALETQAPAALDVKVERQGDQIYIVGEVTELKNPKANVHLRYFLVEDVVRYPGGNGQRLHHHIVRALPGGVDGFAVKEANIKHKALVNVADLKKSLDEYLTDFAKKKKPFLDDEHPLALKHLKVVALIQDDASKEILQAVQIDVPEAK